VLRAGPKLVRNRNQGLEVYGTFSKLWLAQLRDVSTTPPSLSTPFGFTATGRVVRSQEVKDIASFAIQGPTVSLYLQNGKVRCSYDENAGG
jgi:hypothetical protein